ncbi:hypothetical protein [Tsukamurella sp. 1534]|uniref:hypothetical protein n=1 Tax=Tsukamurella sp. 1534 TaxID=1151061 RepID=UPI0006ACBFFD|nr:hypothetical protein [Tsukamurella sp. 1534]
MAEQTLTVDDLRRYADALAEGKRPLVYLIEAVPSLGLAAGASARVIEVSGTMVTVKPAGVDDQLPYEARELRATKQPKPVKPVKEAKAAKASPVKAAAPAKPARSVAVTVFVGADNVASIKVTRNGQKPSGAREVALPAVHKALAGLGDKEATAAVGDVLSAARDAAADRVAALQAELTAAKKSLASLDRAKRGNAGPAGRR